ncbi:glycosyltransferase family 4 protein [Desulfobulbus alkaliphilus]|uniref:glycosyltransferase family 4 protein n=1 Tax=Desulfobulbus alkaliphilus TaxID=869814 RepID=UPI00196288BF|nr:glycosyltransferase family 1 protein [Desulfobulbus alkaliphilus]MBM9538580.1 glycosyltransferase family 4 protein [Desulfobulbus alkaliphilus]
MRIGVNTLFMVPGDVGGTETFLRQTLYALAAHHPECSLVLFTTYDNHEVFRGELGQFPQVEYVLLKFSGRHRPLRISLEQLFLPLAVARARVDALWSPGYTAPFWAPCPQVVTIPDLQYKSFPEDMGRLERMVLDCLVRMACRRCNMVLTISEFSRQEVLRFGFAAPEKVRPVLLGVDPSFATPLPPVDEQESLHRCLTAERPYILCVAHTYPHKNVNVLIGAFAMVAHRIEHNLVFLGRPRRGEPEVLAAESGLLDQKRYIRLASGVPFSDLKRLYQGADLFVLPSAYEGFGLPVLEAMMSGVPVITTRQGSLPEVAGDTVHYIESITAECLAAKILEVVNMNREDRDRLIAAACKRATTFTWQRTADGMKQAFSALRGNAFHG